MAERHDPRLYNDDLAPTTAAHRTWGTYNYIALWFSMSMEVTTYMLASSLIAGGMNWKQAIFTILLGKPDCAGSDAAECACGGRSMGFRFRCL
ncbi:MAG: cytosine permease [Edaphobacter sp.]